MLYGLGLERGRPCSWPWRLLTPSTGFILDSLERFGLADEEKRAVKSKAIATEMLALVILFFTLQSVTALRLALATGALVAMVLVLPILFRFFAREDRAVRAEVGVRLPLDDGGPRRVRRQGSLGVYYLVGAFLVGVLARRFRETVALDGLGAHAAREWRCSPRSSLRSTSSPQARRFVCADFSLAGLGLGVLFLVVAVPVAATSVVLHAVVRSASRWPQSLRVAVPMVPTLVFTLVLWSASCESCTRSPGYVLGGLIVYTLLNTLVPGLVLRDAAPVFDAPSFRVEPVSPGGGSWARPASGDEGRSTSPGGRPLATSRAKNERTKHQDGDDLESADPHVERESELRSQWKRGFRDARCEPRIPLCARDLEKDVAEREASRHGVQKHDDSHAEERAPQEEDESCILEPSARFVVVDRRTADTERDDGLPWGEDLPEAPLDSL